MLRVIIVLLRRQRRRLGNMRRSTSNRGTLNIRRLGIRRVRLDTLCTSSGGVEGLLADNRGLEWGAPAEKAGVDLRGGAAAEGGGAAAVPLQQAGACAGEHGG